MVTEKSELNEEEKRRFHAWMEQHDVSLQCPICGYTSFTKHERVSILPMNARAPLHGYSAAVQIECELCDYRLRFGDEVAEPFFWPATERYSRRRLFDGWSAGHAGRGVFDKERGHRPKPVILLDEVGVSRGRSSRP